MSDLHKRVVEALEQYMDLDPHDDLAMLLDELRSHAIVPTRELLEQDLAYARGIKDGRASLRDVLVETLEARGFKVPRGHETAPTDLVPLLARLLDSYRAMIEESSR